MIHSQFTLMLGDSELGELISARGSYPTPKFWEPHRDLGKLQQQHSTSNLFQALPFSFPLRNSTSTMADRQHNLTVLISGNGSNLQALIDACASGTLPNTRITHVISKYVRG
jgi:hypothetical protein